MAIKPLCDRCKKELKNYGALLFSPPSARGMARKFHICAPCYSEMLKEMKKAKR